MNRVYLIPLALAMMSTISAKAQTTNERLINSVTISQNYSDVSLAEGAELYRKRQYADAIIHFNQALNKKSLSDENKSIAELFIALSRGKLMKENELTIINNFINQTDNSILRNNASVIAANILAETNNLSDAEDILKTVTYNKLNRNNKATYYFIEGYIALKQKQNVEALSCFEKTIELKGDKTNAAKYYIAYINYLEGNYDKAVSIFEELKDKPDFLETNVYILQIKFLEGKFAEVIKEGKEAMELSLDKNYTSEIIRLIGESEFNLKNYSEAISYIATYDKRGGHMTRELNYQMGYSYYMQNMYNQAINYFIKIITGEDALAQNAYYHLADAYIKTGNKAGAQGAFSMASSFMFDKAMAEDALYNYAKLTYESSNNSLYSNKIDLLNKYITLYPNSEHTNELRSYLLSLYINGSNFDKAMSELSKVKNPNTEIRGAVQRICYNKGVELFNDGKYSEAVQMFDKSLSYNVAAKYTALASFWKAESLFKQGIKNDSVIKLYESYLRAAQPSMREYKMAQYNIAYVHFNNEQWTKAITALQKFTTNYSTQDGYLEDAYLRLADSFFALKRYSEAQANYKKSSSIGKLNSDYADYQQALSEGLMGRDDMKIKTLKAISETGTSSYSPQATILLAKTYIQTSQLSNGVEVLEKMIKSNSSSNLMPMAMLELGVAYSNLKEDTKALSTYKSLVQLYPHSPESKDALVAIKAIYVSMGEANDYINYIESLGGHNIDASEKESISYNALQRQFINGAHERVVSLAREYKTKFANGVHTADVQYYLTESLILTGSKEAIQEAETMINMPSNQYTLEVLEKTAELYAQEKNFTKQHSTLIKLYEASVNPSKKSNTLEALTTLAVKTNDSAMKKASVDLVFADKNASEKAKSYAHYANGTLLYDRGAYTEAITELEASKLPNSTAEGVQAKFLVADALFRTGDTAASEKAIIEMSTLDTPHQYWVARAFILYGDIYNASGDKFQAKATYQSIVDGYDKTTDGIITTAKKRIEQLGEVSETNTTPVQ